MPKPLRVFSRVRVKTLTGRIRSALITAINGNVLTLRIGSQNNGTSIVAIPDPTRPRRFMEGNPKPTVTGGVLSEDDNYWYRTFPFSDTLTISGGTLEDAEFLLIGGGGWQSNGYNNKGGGGGGAGGLIHVPSISFNAGEYIIEIGAAGGNNSTFGTFTAFGGGAGQTWYFDSATNGGSGGGGDWNSAGGSGTAGQGNEGGSGFRYYGTVRGGGGGGAGARGDDHNQYRVVNDTWYAGSGGNGLRFLDWASATDTGEDGWYAGGGGGGEWSSYVGLDGLGNNYPNTGGGGRTRYHSPQSGLCILRYPK